MTCRRLFCLSLICGTVVSQTPPPPTPAGTVIRSSVREVLLDMVVRDARGRLITDLKPGDVGLYEDGVRQEIRSFRLVAGREVRIEDQKQAAEAQAAALNSATPNLSPSPFNPLRTVNAVCLILNDLNPETRAFAFDAARKFVNQELRPNTFIGVFSLDSSGLRPVFPFSNNRERLVKALELAAVNQLPSINLAPAAMLNGLSMSVTGSVVPGAGTVGVADGSSVQDPLGIRGDMDFSTRSGLREIDALIGLIKQLSPLPFQKTVLLFGTGLTRPPDQLEYWDSMIHQALKSGVTFYAMDVYGLGVCQGDTSPDCVAHSAMAPGENMLPYVAGLSQQQGPASIGQGSVSGTQSTTSTSSVGAASAAAAAASAQGPPAVSPAAQMMELAHQDDYVKFMVSSANRQEAIRDLAERTGGFMIANTNNTDRLLARVMEEVDTHYELAYSPASEREDGHFRKIEIKLSRAGLTVETRSGYFALPETGDGPITPTEMAGLKALDTSPRPHAFDFRLRTYRFRGPAGFTRYAIAFEMPISNLTPSPADTGDKQWLHTSLLALVKNEHGEIVDRLSKDVQSEVSRDHIAALRAELMTYQHAVDIAPGRYTVEAAVVDHGGNRAATQVIEIDNSARDPIRVSDIALIRQLTDLERAPDAADPFEFTGKRVLPLVGSDIPAGLQPSFYLVVYPAAGAGEPEVRVQLLKDGELLGTLTPQLPALDANGSYPIVIPGAKDPGSYEVHVTSTSNNVSTERSLAYTLGGNSSRGVSKSTSTPE